ncbi:MAG: M20/M25/M40 family metallo-hydrolase [Chitinophagia bacterium]|jgi:carboxypeptidase Q
MLRFTFLSFIFISLMSVVNGQSVADSLMIKKISDEVFMNGKAYSNLRYLCKQVGPRLSGSSGAALAVEQTARMLREAGADTVYLQPCMVPRWVRGDKEVGKAKLSSGKTIDLNIVALGNAVGTGAKGVTAEVVEVKSFAELDALGKDKVKGKIVFFNYRMDPRYISTFRAYGEAGVYRSQGPSRASALGAVGVIVRTLSPVLDDNPHTGATRYDEDKPKIPAVAISTNGAVELSELINKGMVKNIYFRTTCEMLADVESFNVVGELRGSEHPEEVITVGGHLDSWDLAEGAHDDGTGCMQSIEIIRAFKALGIKPKRSIRAVMFMNEENGLRGGSKYAELAKAEPKKFIMAMESDAGGFTPRGFGFTASASQRDRILSWQPLFRQYGALEFNEGGGGADIGPLRSLGTALIGLNPDSQRYMDLHHAKTDVFEAVSERELNLGVVVMAGMVYLVSQYGL